MCEDSKKINRKPPTEEQLLRAATQHLKFEVFCLLDNLQVLGNTRVAHKNIGVFFDFKMDKARGINHPVSYHDMLIHTRVLGDFLKCSSSCKLSIHREDIEAGDYIPDWEGLDTIDESDRRIINKAFAHLSRTRATMEVMSLSKRTEIAKNVISGIKEFTGKACQYSEQYAEWFGDLNIKLNSIELPSKPWHFGESES